MSFQIEIYDGNTTKKEEVSCIAGIKRFSYAPNTVTVTMNHSVGSKRYLDSPEIAAFHDCLKVVDQNSSHTKYIMDGQTPTYLVHRAFAPFRIFNESSGKSDVFCEIMSSVEDTPFNKKVALFMVNFGELTVSGKISKPRGGWHQSTFSSCFFSLRKGGKRGFDNSRLAIRQMVAYFYPKFYEATAVHLNEKILESSFIAPSIRGDYVAVLKDILPVRKTFEVSPLGFEDVSSFICEYIQTIKEFEKDNGL